MKKQTPLLYDNVIFGPYARIIVKTLGKIFICMGVV